MIDPYSDAVTARDHDGPNSGAEYSELLPHSLREAVTAQEDHLRDWIRLHPLAAICGALALGFAVARWMREE